MRKCSVLGSHPVWLVVWMIDYLGDVEDLLRFVGVRQNLHV